MYEGKYKPIDIQNYCRVYFTFLSEDYSEKVLFYDRPQTLSDATLTAEAMDNAEKMKRKYGFTEFLSIYIARTSNEVNAFESYEYLPSKSNKPKSSTRKTFGVRNLFSLVLVVLISAGVGYFIGINQSENYANLSSVQKQLSDYKSDYAKGWAAWFTHYGLNGSGKGIPYMNQYIYGRNYDDLFVNSQEAFYSGYKDAFYLVNRREPEGTIIESMQSAYIMYYQE